MTYTPSQERMKYHDLMADFMRLLKPASRVYDIGKSNYHDYRNNFDGHTFIVIDMEKEKGPDIVLDIEGINNGNVSDYLDQADGVLCNGVVEQCNDPHQMIRSCNALVKHGGYVLFGMVLLGYPPHECDRFRFTDSGARLAVRRAGFDLIKVEVVQRNDVDSYIYVMAQKARSV